MQSALDLVIIAFLDVEQMEVLAKHGGLHQLGDGARAGGAVEEEDGVGAALDHLFLLEDDLLAAEFVGGEEVWTHVGHLRAEHGVAFAEVGEEQGGVLEQDGTVVLRDHVEAVIPSPVEAEGAAAKDMVFDFDGHSFSV